MALAAPLLLVSGSAHAIPSPEVVVSFFSNTAQIFGLLTLAVGGAFFSHRQKLVRRRGVASRGTGGNTSRYLLACLLILLVASAAANVLQWSQSKEERLARLSANLFRASKEAGKQVGDVSLKTLPLSEQIRHPQGISTDDLAQILRAADGKSAEDGQINLIDVREDAEWETGRLEGFRHTRFPDVVERIEALQAAGKTNVLLCHSGNRSSELCAILAKRGIDCKFVVGGYEKWIAEGRAITRPDGSAAVTALRAIPAFNNDTVLLDTADVRRMVEEEGAIFVDVRYPLDFSRGHLPGAINLPIRKLPQRELEAGLSQIPRKPVVAPCYDRRSCFYAKILGLRLTRLGYDFRGRYTVPHEYTPPGPPISRPYIANWLAANEDTFIGRTQKPVADLLKWLAGRLDSMVLAIFVVVLLLRLVLLPLTAKGERDQFLQQKVAGKIRELKRHHENDPWRLKASIQRLYRTYRLTPGWNVAALVVQVLCLLVLFSAVTAAVPQGSAGFLWIADIGLPDRLYGLPALLGLLVFLQLELGAARHTAKLTGLRLFAGVLFGLITFQLKAALVLYLIFGLTLMMLQSLIFRTVMRWQEGKGEDERPLPVQITPLRSAHRVPGAGRKAERLGLLMQAGIPVPPGLVIPHGLFTRTRKSETLSPRSEQRLRRLCRRLGLKNMAVRSSGASEDGDAFSYAGVFDSVLNVDRQGLSDAIAQVRRSFANGCASSYGDGNGGGGVIVQAMVDAEYAGVLFTEHPSQSGCLLVEMTEGLGEKLVSGTEKPTSFEFGRVTGQPNDGAEPPMDLGPLIRLAMRIEEMFGQPQDLEWAYRKGRFYILQARNITVLERLGDAHTPVAIFERERHRLLDLARECAPDEIALAQNELSELLPKPTPLSISFMEKLWKPGGSVDLACHMLGIPYDIVPDADPVAVSVFGSLYVNMHEQRRRTRKGIGMLASFRLSRAAENIERDFREQFLPEYLSELRLLEATDFTKIPVSDLIGLIEDTSDRFVQDSHVQVDLINIAADFYVKAAERSMRKRGMNSGAVLGQGTVSVMHRAMDMLHQLRQGEATPEEFLSIFGHRSTVDYELSLPRYREDIGMIEALLHSAAAMDGMPHGAKANADVSDDPTFALMIMRAQRFQALKEEAKHYSLREFAVIRRMFVELDRRLGLDGGIFYLEFDDVIGMRGGGPTEEIKRLIEARRAACAFFAGLEPFDTALTLRDLETVSIEHGTRAGKVREVAHSGLLQGSLVAGSEPVVARARVLNGQNIQSIADGEIAVARYMHPGWTPVFPRLKGIVTEVGGWLSHTSILAREYGITTIIGVKSAEYHIRTGDLLRLNLDGTAEILERAAAAPDDVNDRPEGDVAAPDDVENAAALSAVSTAAG